MSRIEFQIKKDGFLGGGTRTIKLIRDNVVKEVTPKFAGKVCNVRVPGGLPNTTRPSVNYYQEYNFERETWWPKFEQLKSKYGITIVKGDKTHKSRGANNANNNRPNYTNNNNQAKSASHNNNPTVANTINTSNIVK